MTPDAITIDSLTERQFDALCLMGCGFSNDEIAKRMCISPHTAKFHTNALFALFGVSTRTSCIVKALRLGVVSLSDFPEDS